MKKITQLFAFIIMMSGIFFTSCKGPSEKEGTAEIELREANEAMAEEQRNHQMEVDEFKRSIEVQIAENENSIQDFNTTMAQQKSEIKADYEQKMAVLKAKNAEIKLKMNEFQSDNKQNWDLFKIELNRDLEELGNDLRELNTKN
jgi:lipopolysaccharide export LptBFGC system permease protein LptF